MKIPVLIIEDNQLNMELLLAILESFAGRVEVAVAYDGERGLERFNRLSPRLVLLDMQLPGIDGFTLAKKIKETNEQTAIIGLTAYAMVGDKERVLDAGCDYYLAKPLDVTEVKQLISAIIGMEDSHDG